MILHPMTTDWALDINGRLIEAWMVREGVRSGPMPSLRGVRLADARAAVAMIAGGNAPSTCRLDAACVSRLFAWAVVQSQMS